MDLPIRIQTCNLPVTSPTLYRLSYQGSPLNVSRLLKYDTLTTLTHRCLCVCISDTQLWSICESARPDLPYKLNPFSIFFLFGGVLLEGNTILFELTCVSRISLKLCPSICIQCLHLPEISLHSRFELWKVCWLCPKWPSIFCIQSRKPWR